MSNIQFHQFEITVSPAMIDENRHVNNVEYVRWMQEAAISHAAAAGYLEATSAVGATWFVHSHQIEYLQPASENDVIVVRTWVSELRKASTMREYQFMRRGEQTVLARGRTQWVFVDAATGEPRALPENIRDLIKPVEEPARA